MTTEPLISILNGLIVASHSVVKGPIRRSQEDFDGIWRHKN
jgi:hypothetical protein